MEKHLIAVGEAGRPGSGAAGPPLRADVAQSFELSVSILRGLAFAGYFTPEQLRQMESVLNGKPAACQRRQWLTLAEACDLARISRTTLWRHSQAGLITVRRIKGRRLVERQELESLIVGIHAR